jgi:molybdopterin converting factor small subunit
VRVKIHYIGLVRNVTNRSEDELELEEGSSLEKLLEKLAVGYGKPFEKDIFEPGMDDLKGNFVATINGVLIGQLKGINTPLKNGDSIMVMSLMTGG